MKSWYGGLIAAGAATLAVAASASALGAGGSSEPFAELSSAARQQLFVDAQVETADFTPGQASIENLSVQEAVDHNDGKLLTADDAVARARDAVGLSDKAPIATVTLLSVTPSAYGFELEPSEAKPSRILPIYQDAAAWAVEFENVGVPVSAPWQEEQVLVAGSPTSYTTNMVVFIEAYTGEFMLGAQHDPGEDRE